MSKSIIIAKYKEDISWMNDIPNASFVVYNKDEQNQVEGQISLPNIGRECHTYLYHLVNNYDNLADTNIFMQGRPNDHAPNFMKALSKDVYEPFEFVSEFYQDENIFHISTLVPDQLSPEVFLDTLLLLEKPPFYNYRFWGGAMFAVSRERIQQRSKEFYQQMLDLSISEPKLPWIMERLWPHVFN